MSPHGTNARYTRGCRCARCREARRAYAVELRHRRALREGRPPGQFGRPLAHDDVIDTLLEVLAGP